MCFPQDSSTFGREPLSSDSIPWRSTGPLTFQNVDRHVSPSNGNWIFFVQSELWRRSLECTQLSVLPSLHQHSWRVYHHESAKCPCSVFTMALQSCNTLNNNNDDFHYNWLDFYYHFVGWITVQVVPCIWYFSHIKVQELISCWGGRAVLWTSNFRCRMGVSLFQALSLK